MRIIIWKTFSKVIFRFSIFCLWAWECPQWAKRLKVEVVRLCSLSGPIIMTASLVRLCCEISWTSPLIIHHLATFCLTLLHVSNNVVNGKAKRIPIQDEIECVQKQNNNKNTEKLKKTNERTIFPRQMTYLLFLTTGFEK